MENKKEIKRLYNKHLENIKILSKNPQIFKIKWLNLNQIYPFFDLDFPHLDLFEYKDLERNDFLKDYINNIYDFGKLLYNEGTYTPYIVTNRDSNSYAILEGRHRISSLKYYLNKNNIKLKNYKVLCIIIPKTLANYKEFYFNYRDNFLNNENLFKIKEIYNLENVNNPYIYDFYHHKKNNLLKNKDIELKQFDNLYSLLFNLIFSIVLLTPGLKKYQIYPSIYINNEEEYHKWINNLI